MLTFRSKISVLALSVLVCTAGIQVAAFGQAATRMVAEKYLALPLKNAVNKHLRGKILRRYGIPFMEETLPVPARGTVSIPVGAMVKRIFLLGMTEHATIRAWANPLNDAVRFFVGDNLGRITLHYADGSTQVFPLVLGENIWWGHPFDRFPDPFPTDAQFRSALRAALRLYPQRPVKSGNYVAVINPRRAVLQSITVQKSPGKDGTPQIRGITLQTAGPVIAGPAVLSPGVIPRRFLEFIHSSALSPAGGHRREIHQQLHNLRLAMYTSDANFTGHVAAVTPPGYAGPHVSFKGDIFARILANAFRCNLQDMVNKIGKNGMYHTSTKGAVSWNGAGFGTFRKNVGMYYGASWSRDLGRTLQELTELGYTAQGKRCADYCLRMAQLWRQRPGLKIDGHSLPPHWGRIINRPMKLGCFENDGHGLIIMFLYTLWQRLPNRDQWLRARWPGVKEAGDWILWQFAHPNISGASHGVLHTTSECARGNGYSVFADDVCMDALNALARMADSIGRYHRAALWRARAAKMKRAITRQYIVTVPHYGRVWTLAYAGWPDRSTVLGPLIFQADDQGFAPQDGVVAWRSVDLATFRRLIHTYNKPFGFYGQAMGYGQGFVTEAALLLDRMRNATTMLTWMAKAIYDPRIGSFIVPEGCQIDPSGRYWFRTGDLGNGVQEAEIIKTLRLVIGVDDTHPDRLQFFPRMPYGWRRIKVAHYPVLFQRQGATSTTHLRYVLKRHGPAMALTISADTKLGPVAMRLGPFKNRPAVGDVRINGAIPAGDVVEHSGDSWWIGFTANVGPQLAAGKKKGAL